MKKLVPIFGWTLALLNPCSAAPSGPIWTNVSSGLSGAVPGVSQVVIDRVTGTTFYALTSSGSIFKSTDSGSSWTALGNIAGVNVIALDPTASTTVYAGTAHGVVKTIDGGQGWSPAGLSDVAVSVLAIDPYTLSTLYANGDVNSIYKSVDGGAGWTSVSLGITPKHSGDAAIASIAIDPLTPSTLYVLTGGPGVPLYKSTDGGESWSIINPGDFFAPLLAPDPSVPSTLYALRGGAGLSKSTDGGATWATTGFTGNPVGLAIDPVNSNRLYVSADWPMTFSIPAQHAIMESTDGGQTWNAVDTIIPLARSLVLSPNRSVYATTGTGIFKSTDGGMNWGETNTGLRVLDIQVLAGDPVNAGTIYAGANYGLFKSVDGGANWTQGATFGVDSLLIDFTNSSVLYAGTGPCGLWTINLYKSADGGATWNDSISSYSPTSGCLAATEVMAMDPIDPNTLYLPFGDDWNGFTVLKTMDGGTHWKNLGAGELGAANEINALVIDPNTPAVLYAATDSGVVRSTDGGASFIPAGFANMTVVLFAIDPVRSNVLYAATSNNSYPPAGFLGLYKSTDSGASWSPINQGLDEIVAAHAPANELLVDSDHTNILYLATSGY